MTTRFAAVTMNWADDRYFRRVLWQLAYLKCFGCDSLVVHTPRPWFWLSDEALPANRTVEIAREEAPSVELVTHDGGAAHSEDDTRNFAIDYLKQRYGTQVVLWLDADYLFTRDDLATIARWVAFYPPQAYAVNAFHFWRGWDTTYARTGLRLGTTTTDHFPAARHQPEWTLPATCYHPSYVLTDAEVKRKVSSWGHAELFRETNWYERWLSRDIDKTLELKPFDVRTIPEELRPWTTPLI